MSAEDRAASKGGLTDAQFNELMRIVRETVRAEIRAELEGRREAGSMSGIAAWPDQRSTEDAAAELLSRFRDAEKLELLRRQQQPNQYTTPAWQNQG